MLEHPLDTNQLLKGLNRSVQALPDFSLLKTEFSKLDLSKSGNENNFSDRERKFIFCSFYLIFLNPIISVLIDFANGKEVRKTIETL